MGVCVQLNGTVMSELAIYRVEKFVATIYRVGKLVMVFCCITCKVLAAK